LKTPKLPKPPREPKPRPQSDPTPKPQAPARRGFAPVDPVAAGELEKELEALAELKWDKERMETELTELNIKIEAQNDLCVERMDRIGMQSTKLQKAMFIRSHQKKPNVLDEAKMFEDLEKRGLGALIKRNVHYQTLVGTLNEFEKTGAAPLDGVEVKKRQIVVVRRVGGART
jgi:hypothetical protein